MIDVPENIKEIIDSSVKEAFAPFGKILEQNNKQEQTEKENDLDGVSDAVKHWLYDKTEQPFAGRTIYAKSFGGGMSPNEIEKMKPIHVKNE